MFKFSQASDMVESQFHVSTPYMKIKFLYGTKANKKQFIWDKSQARFL